MIIKGDIIYTEKKEEYKVHENSYLIIKDGIIEGIYKK